MIWAADLDEDKRISKDEFMRVMRKMKLIWISFNFFTINQIEITKLKILMNIFKSTTYLV